MLDKVRAVKTRTPVALLPSFAPITLFFCTILSLVPLKASSAENSARVGLKQFADGFVSPIALIPLADGTGRFLVADQAGAIYTLNKDGTRMKAVPGLAQQALQGQPGRLRRTRIAGAGRAPEVQGESRFFVVYSAPSGGWPRQVGPHDATLRVQSAPRQTGRCRSGFRASRAPNRQALLQSQRRHHCFRSRRYLYIAVGDGGNANGQGLDILNRWQWPRLDDIARQDSAD